MDDLIGKKVEQFLIETFIGHGKTGAVYQARDLNLDRSVAIKFLSPELAVQRGIQQLVAQAARTVSSLTHSSIVTLYNVGHQDGRAYMVMDYVNGMGLNKALQRLASRRQFMPLDEALHIIAQAADALSAAHQIGVRHLNLKPSNILIKRQQRPSRPGETSLRAMLTDFGLSLIPETGLHAAHVDLSSNYPYLSPEQCTNGYVDGRSDIYSLGIILYQMLTSRLPFDIHTPTEAIMRHSVESPPPLDNVRADLSPAVTMIVNTALAKDPANRFQLAEQMADALRQAARITSPMADTPPTRAFTGVQKMAANPTAARPAARATAAASSIHQSAKVSDPSPIRERPDRVVEERLEPPTPPQPTPAPASPRPTFNAAQLALSETMPVQPQFDTPIFEVPPYDRRKKLNHQVAPAPPSNEPDITPSPLHQQGAAEQGTAVPSQSTPVPTLSPPLETPLEELPTDVHVMDLPEQEGQIVIIRQGRGPRQVTLNKPQILIGRAKDNDIVLNARDVSRYHARLNWVNGRWRVTDLDSSGGTFGNGRRLPVNEPESWPVEQILQIGSYFLHWATATEASLTSNVNEEPKTELFHMPEDASQIQSTSGRFSVALHPALITMMAGEQTTVQIELFNQGATTDTLKLAVGGLPAGTFSLTQHFVTLAPGARANIPLVLQLPETGTLMSYRIAAGNYPFELITHSKTTEGETAVISGMLIVTTLEQFSLGIWPSQVDDGDNIRILIRNEGNVANSYSLVGRDEKSLIQFGGQRGRVQLKPGEAVTQVVTVRTRQQPLLGSEREIPFEVEVRTENGQQQIKTAYVKVKPQVPKWALWLSTIVAVLLLSILIATAVFTQSQAQSLPPTPANVTPASQPLTDAVNVQHTDAP